MTDIMKLPCVFSCHKERDDSLCFLLYDWDENGHYVEVRPGDKLCEDHDGKWHVIKNDEKKQKKKKGTTNGCETT